MHNREYQIERDQPRNVHYSWQELTFHIAGGQIKLGSRIAKDKTTVDFAAGGPIRIMGDIGFNSQVRLLSVAGNITVVGGITGGGTRLITWPKGAASPQVSGGATWAEQEWAVPEALTRGPKQEGYWWENWPQSFGYVAPSMTS